MIPAHVQPTVSAYFFFLPFSEIQYNNFNGFFLVLLPLDLFEVKIQKNSQRSNIQNEYKTKTHTQDWYTIGTSYW